MYEMIANPPWYVPTILAAVAVIFLMQGNNRQNKELKFAGLGFAIAAALVYAVSHFLESPHERVVRQTEEVAAAVDKREWDRFAALLDPKVKFWLYDGKEALRINAERSAESVGVKDITLSNMVIKDEPGAHIIHFSAAADIDRAGRRIPTNWRFHWDADTYLLYRIDHVPNPTFGDDAVFSRLVKP
jgi:hypothetical protein